MAENKKLFLEFPPVSTEQWEEVINKDLKGADYERKLVWKTLEGIKARPYYRAENLENLTLAGVNPEAFKYIKGNKTDSNEWSIRQDIQVKSVKEANKTALKYLDKGLNAIGFVFEDDFEMSQEQFSALVKDICFNTYEINFVANHGTHIILPLLEKELQNRGMSGEAIKGSISLDPFGNMSLKGNFMVTPEKVYEVVADLAKTGHEKFPNFKVISVHANHFANAGASITQELAYGLAMANEYLAKATEKGVSVDTVSAGMQMVFGVGSSYFLEIAKIRAARLLWAAIVKKYNPAKEDSKKLFIHAQTNDWNKTLFDPYVNMLRTTTEAMSAILGGVDSLTVERFDKSFRAQSDFAYRIARNQQILLKEESYFDKVIDPSAGSYYIENLTESIANEAWKLFLEVEEKGGYLEAFKAGFIQDSIEETANTRNMKIATRREILVGTNQYPNFDEQISDDLNKEIVDEEIKTVEGEQFGRPINLYRGAEAFEELRLKTENADKQPLAYMLPVGNLAMRKARSMFSCNFFACAGFEVVDNNGFDNVEDGVKAALEAKADIVVVCSSDEEYAEAVPKAFELLNGKAITVVAGAPACMDELKEKGIENFIHVKVNVLDTLKEYQNKLGI